MGILPSGGTTLLSVTGGTLEQMSGGFLLALSPFMWVTFLKKIFIYLAAPGTGFSMWDLPSSLCHAGSLAVAWQLSVAACGI